MWNLFTIKTLLDRAGLRTGAPGMAAFLSGVRVSGTITRYLLKFTRGTMARRS